MPPQQYLSTDPNAGAAQPGTGDRAYLSTDPNAGSPSPEPEPKTAAGFFGNAVRSGAEFVGNTVRGASLLGRATAAPFTGAYMEGTPLADPELIGIAKQLPGSADRMLSGAAEYFNKRYGSMAKAGETLYEDPVGMAADASTVLTMGGGAVAQAPGMAGRVGRAASALGAAVDPIAAAARTAGAVVPGMTRAAAGAVAPGRVIAEQGDLFGAPAAITQAKAPSMVGRTLRTLAASGAGHYLGDPTGGIGSAVAMQALESPAVRASMSRGITQAGTGMTRTAHGVDASSEALLRLALMSRLQGGAQ